MCSTCGCYLLPGIGRHFVSMSALLQLSYSNTIACCQVSQHSVQQAGQVDAMLPSHLRPETAYEGQAGQLMALEMMHGTSICIKLQLRGK